MVDFAKFPRGVSGRNLASNIAPYATWANSADLLQSPRWSYQEGHIFLGSVDVLEDKKVVGRPLGVSDNRHVMTVAGSRAGKGVSVIIPNLLTYVGSMLVIDPKGENAKVTAASRGHGSPTVSVSLGQDVYVLDPFGVSGHRSSSFNPLSMIDPKADTAVDDAALIAEALVIEDPGPNKHFSSAARNFLRGLILYACTEAKPEQRTLLRVRELLTLDPVQFKELLKWMMASDLCAGAIRRSGASLAAKDQREASAVISTAIEQTDFLDSPALARCLGRSDFSLADLKRRATTVYLCLPAARMATHNRWLRIIINLALQAMENEKTVPEFPVVFLMDEFAVLDRMESLEKAAGLMAGFDVKLWPILQDLSQLQAIYKDRWETFMGNAGLLQFFGNNDLTTLKYISERLGKSAIQQITQNEVSTEQISRGFTGKSTQIHTVDLMTPEEIGRFFSRQSRAQILFWPGGSPIAVDRVEYFKHPWFNGKYEEQR